MANGEGMAIKPVEIGGHLPIVRSGVVVVHQLEHLHYSVFDADQRPVKCSNGSRLPIFLEPQNCQEGGEEKEEEPRRRPRPSQSGKTIW